MQFYAALQAGVLSKMKLAGEDAADANSKGDHEVKNINKKQFFDMFNALR